MSAIFTFIVENPFIFILIVLVIYSVISVISLKNRVKEIEKVFRPLRDYIISHFDEDLKLINDAIASHQEEEKVTNELTRLVEDINKAKTGDINTLVKTSNDMNYFVLNSALIRTNEFPELTNLINLELFKNDETEELKDLNMRRISFNNMIKDFNHDILNPPNSIIVALFNVGSHYLMLESNEGKEPKVAEGNYVKSSAPVQTEVVNEQPQTEEVTNQEGVASQPPVETPNENNPTIENNNQQ